MMFKRVILTNDQNQMVIKIPMTLKRKSGRRMIFLPDGQAPQSILAEPDDTLVCALLRAHRWNKMLDSGKARSIAELARNEKISDSYLARVLRLSLLAPDIKKAILDGQHPKGFHLNDMLKKFPMLWEQQRKYFGFTNP